MGAAAAPAGTSAPSSSSADRTLGCWRRPGTWWAPRSSKPSWPSLSARGVRFPSASATRPNAPPSDLGRGRSPKLPPCQGRVRTQNGHTREGHRTAEQHRDGLSRTHTESEVRAHLAWCADRKLDPLAAGPAQIELYIRWMQEVRWLELSTAGRRMSVVVGFHRTCVVDGVARSAADYLRRPPPQDVRAFVVPGRGQGPEPRLVDRSRPAGSSDLDSKTRVSRRTISAASRTSPAAASPA